MKTKIALLAGILASSLVPSLASAAMTDAECASGWSKADANGAGVVTEAEASRYFAMLRIAEKPIADGKLTKAQFLEFCKAGVFTKAEVEAGAPLPGANSFTEGQAKDRAIGAGFTNVSALKKDDKGVWRGTASDGTKSVSIAVDYKGNVVAN
jgi:hypothetical protein